MRRSARGRGDRLALVSLDESGAEVAALTYRDLDERARSIAAALTRRIAPGERVLLAFHDQVEFASSLIACGYAGAVGVPVPVPHSAKYDKGRFARIAGIVNDCAPAMALASPRIAESVWPHARVHGIDLRCEPVDRLAAEDPEGFEPREASPEELFYLQYTSGSTGAPRGVRVSHRNLGANVREMRDVLRLDVTAPFVTWLPHYHDMGLVCTMCYPLFFGATTYVMPTAAFLKRPLRWLETIARYRAGSSAAPSFAFESCVRRIAPEAIAALDLSSLTGVVVGAEPIPEATLERFSQAFAPARFRRSAWAPSYGLAESTVFVSARRAPDGYRTLETAAHLRSVSCGRAADGVAVRIVDPDTREPVQAGSPGEIVVAGDSVTASYWSSPIDTVTLREADGGSRAYLATGDVGALVDGDLCITGRLKDVIIINGSNHHAADIEATIMRDLPTAVPGGCAAFGATLDGLERLVVAVEMERERPASPEALLGEVRKAVAERHDVTVSDLVTLRPGRLPRTSSGKIRRGEARERYLLGELR